MQIIGKVNEYLDFYTDMIQKNVFETLVLDEIDYGTADDDELLAQIKRIYKQNSELVDRIYFVKTDGGLISTDNLVLFLAGDERQRKDYATALDNPHKLYWTDILRSPQNNFVVSAYKAIASRDGRSAGVLFVEISMDRINRMLSKISIGEKGSIMFLDGSNEGNSTFNRYILMEFAADIAASNEITPVLLEEINRYPQGKIDYLTPSNNRYFIFYSTYSKLNGKVVSVINQKLYQQSFDELNRGLLMIGILGLIIVVVVSVLISLYVSKPLKRFVKRIKNVGRGDLDVRIASGRKDEIGQLYNEFNRMSAKLKELIQNLYDTERGRRRRNCGFCRPRLTPIFCTIH